MAQAGRPLSPHLQIYRWYLTMALSILHRMTGCALAFGTILLVWWLTALASGPDAFATVQSVVHSWFGVLVMFGLPILAAIAALNSVAVAVSRFASTQVVVFALCGGAWTMFIRPSTWSYRVPGLLFVAGIVSLLLPLVVSHGRALLRRRARMALAADLAARQQMRERVRRAT